MNEPVQTKRGTGRTAASAARTNDPQRTMHNIVEVATKEFADKGLSGAAPTTRSASQRRSRQDDQGSRCWVLRARGRDRPGTRHHGVLVRLSENVLHRSLPLPGRMRLKRAEG